MCSVFQTECPVFGYSLYRIGCQQYLYRINSIPENALQQTIRICGLLIPYFAKLAAESVNLVKKEAVIKPINLEWGNADDVIVIDDDESQDENDDVIVIDDESQTESEDEDKDAGQAKKSTVTEDAGESSSNETKNDDVIIIDHQHKFIQGIITVND